jgi:hypothetical protein
MMIMMIDSHRNEGKMSTKRNPNGFTIVLPCKVKYNNMWGKEHTKEEEQGNGLRTRREISLELLIRRGAIRFNTESRDEFSKGNETDIRLNRSGIAS